MTVIADKGFGSNDNFDMLEKYDLKFIFPLRRNNGMINRDRLKTGDKNDFDGYFLHKGRVIWYYSYEKNKTVSIYLDSVLKNQGEKDYASL